MAAENPTMLNSWKEIASFLDRGVRTVQRWERDLQLPVHRIGRGSRSPVYATARELRFWMATSDAGSVRPKPTGHPVFVTPNGGKTSRAAIQESRRLIAESLRLARSVAATSVRHQRQAELLQKRILEIRSRIRPAH